MPDWLEYDWQVRGIPATFQVDPRYYENLPEGHDTLLWLSAQPRELDEPLSPGEIRRADSLLKKAQRTLRDAHYVGAILLPTQRQYYFYTAEEEGLAALEALEIKEKKLLVTAGRSSEPKWQTYTRLLYPDAAKTQTMENEKTIALLRRQGDGLSHSRRLKLYLFFPTEPSRLLFQEQARIGGFAIGDPIFQPEQTLPYGITILCVSSLEKREVDSFTTRAIREAERQGGVMMGWDCAMIPKKHPLR